MRNVGQSIEDARNQACRFIRGHLAVYERFKNSPIAKYRASAFRSLGAALHPVMDSTSPEHAGWQMWDPLGHPGQIFEHGNLSSEDVFHLTPVLLQETKRRIEAVLRGDPCSCIL
jgi:hypothetical protein